MISEVENEYKKRVIQAFKLLGLKVSDVASFLDIKADTLRRSISRGKIHDGYLIILEKKYGIRKEWIARGEKPILINKDNEISSFINETNKDSLDILESMDKEKILAYLILKERDFIMLDSFKIVMKKLNLSLKLSNIANEFNGDDKD